LGDEDFLMGRPPMVRVRFHASGPDGRQAMPVTVDVPVLPSVPQVVVVSVEKRLFRFARWTFSGVVDADGTPDPVFQVNGVGPVAIEAIEDVYVEMQYASEFNVGDPWNLASAPTSVLSKTGVIVGPESGVIVI
jgi:hypothetical protein